MIRLARALPGIAVMAFDLRCATPVLPVATAQHVPSAPRSLPKATRQQTASTKIPIASDARPRHTSRGFLPWRFAYAGPGARSHTFMGAGIRKPSQSRTSDRLDLYRKLHTLPVESTGTLAMDRRRFMTLTAGV